MRPLLRTLALAGALLLAPAAPALADDPTTAEVRAGIKLLQDYTFKGTIEPCEYTVAQLEAALAYAQQPDVKQYGSDFPRAIRDAIAAHAGGACEQPEPTPAPTEAPTTTGGAGVQPPSAPSTPSTPAAPAEKPAEPQTVVADPPAPAAVATATQPSGPDPALERAVAAGLVLVAAAMLSTLRRLGGAGGPLAAPYHSWREARWRAGGVWDDFRDWARTGR